MARKSKQAGQTVKMRRELRDAYVEVCHARGKTVQAEVTSFVEAELRKHRRFAPKVMAKQPTPRLLRRTPQGYYASFREFLEDVRDGRI
jgi:NCAIR mutase (PurE)-related protein